MTFKGAVDAQCNLASIKMMEEIIFITYHVGI